MPLSVLGFPSCLSSSALPHATLVIRDVVSDSAIVSHESGSAIAQLVCSSSAIAILVITSVSLTQPSEGALKKEEKNVLLLSPATAWRQPCSTSLTNQRTPSTPRKPTSTTPNASHGLARQSHNTRGGRKNQSSTTGHPRDTTLLHSAGRQGHPIKSCLLWVRSVRNTRNGGQAEPHQRSYPDNLACHVSAEGAAQAHRAKTRPIARSQHAQQRAVPPLTRHQRTVRTAMSDAADCLALRTRLHLRLSTKPPVRA